MSKKKAKVKKDGLGQANEATEIDDIFAAPKSKSDAVELIKSSAGGKTDEPARQTERPEKKLKRKADTEAGQGSSSTPSSAKRQLPYRGLEDDAFADSRGERGAKTQDGLKIYQASEILGMHGGDTPECPWDCQCCY